jgi:two-component sensor histidine kinase
MNKSFIYLFLIFFLNFGFCQNLKNKKSIDSLLVLVNNTKIDTIKINIYHLICKKFYIEDVSKMKQFNDKIFVLSKKANYPKGIGLYYLNLADMDYMNRDLTKGVKDSEEAYKILSKTTDVKYHLDAASYLAYAYSDNLEHEKARNIIKENLRLAHQFNNPKILAKMYLFIGRTFDYDVASTEAMKYYKKSLYYYNKADDKIGKLALYQSIALAYKNIHLYEEALEYLNLAINQKPDEYYFRLLMLEKARIYNCLGLYSKAKSITEKTEQYFIKTNKNTSDMFWLNKLCMAISNCELKEYNEAIKNGEQILAAEIDYDTKMAVLNILSESYLKLNNLQQSKIYIDQSLNLLKLVSNKEYFDQVYKIKSEVEEAFGNYKTALFYNQKYSSTIRENNDNINKNKFEQLQVDFKVTEKENKIKKLEITSLQKTLNIEKQRKYLIISLFVISIALLLIIVFIKVTKSIKKRNEKIEIANIELSKASILIQKSLKEKELLLKEIHHRVKNNLQLVMSLLNIQAREGNAKDIKEFLEKGQSRIISMALIHENLYQTDKLDKVIFQDYIENLITNINSTFSDNNSKIVSAINAENINFDIQTSIPLGLIINELYCNILKHAFPDNKEGNVTIEITEVVPKDFQLKISDNGKGMTKSATNKRTLGIELVHLLVDQLKGTIKCYEDNGTTYSIKFKEIA